MQKASARSRAYGLGHDVRLSGANAAYRPPVTTEDSYRHPGLAFADRAQHRMAGGAEPHARHAPLLTCLTSREVRTIAAQDEFPALCVHPTTVAPAGQIIVRTSASSFVRTFYATRGWSRDHESRIDPTAGCQARIPTPFSRRRAGPGSPRRSARSTIPPTRRERIRRASSTVGIAWRWHRAPITSAKKRGTAKLHNPCRMRAPSPRMAAPCGCDRAFRSSSSRA